MFCTECGANNEDTQEVCKVCGAVLNGMHVNSQPQQEQVFAGGANPQQGWENFIGADMPPNLSQTVGVDMNAQMNMGVNLNNVNLQKTKPVREKKKISKGKRVLFSITGIAVALIVLVLLIYFRLLKNILN